MGANLVVVNDVFLASVLPSETDLGRRAGGDYEWTVVGVTGAIRQHRIDEETSAEAYVLFDDLLESRPTSASLAMRSVHILAETPRGVPATLQIIRTAVADLMPAFTIRSAAAVMELIRSHLGSQRLVAAGAGSSRSSRCSWPRSDSTRGPARGWRCGGREIGIRMALGASVRRIAFELARPLGVVYVAGVGPGTGLLLLSGSATRAAIVPPPGGRYPPLWAVAAASAVVLLAAFTAACYRPIRRATRVDPADSLRAD